MVTTSRDTRARIFAAARDEFAAHGIAGARMRRIAAAAGVSHERLYAYFGDKQNLYIQVRDQAVSEIAAITIDPLDVAGWVARLFDYVSSHRDFFRLERWGQLEGIDQTTNEIRREQFRQNEAALREAQMLGLVDGSFSASEMYAILGALASLWEHAPADLRELDRDRRGTSDLKIQQARRDAVIRAALRIIAPTSGPDEREDLAIRRRAITTGGA